MTDRFVLPEGNVDVPAIVRREMWLMLKACGADHFSHIHVDNLRAYLAARFGETPTYRGTACPERPTPSAPAHPKENTHTQRCPERHPTGRTQCSLEAGHEGNHADWGGVWAAARPEEPKDADGNTHAFMLFDGSKEYGCLFTPAHREFIEALAAHYDEVGNDRRVAKSVAAAARKVVIG